MILLFATIFVNHIIMSQFTIVKNMIQFPPDLNRI